jgi:cAMP-dependent protein kinase regulator
MSKKPTREEYKNYLDKKVNCIIKPLIVDLLKNRPDDVADYVVGWCQTKGKEIEGSNKKNNTTDKENVKKVEIEEKPVQEEEEEVYDDSHLPKSEESSINEEDVVDDFEMEEKLKNHRKSKKKNGISAEAYGEYNKLSDFQARVIDKSEEQKDQIRGILSENFMFKSLEPNNQDIVIMAMKIVNCVAGDTIIKQGDDGDEMYIVGAGKLRCCKLFDGKEEETFLKTYHAGEVFGELSLMYNTPRAASIYADEESALYSLDRDTFNHIVKNATIQRRNMFEEFIGKIEILQDLDNYERQKICDCLETERFNKGDLVITEGEFGEKFFFIQDGTAEAFKTEESSQKVVFEFKANDYFGELALLNGDKRQASIRVTSDNMCVASLSKQSFKRLLGPIENILERNKDKYAKYVKA